MDGAARFRKGLKVAYLMAQGLLILAGKNVLPSGVLHLAKIDHVVRTDDEQIDLTATHPALGVGLASPRANFGVHARYAQRRLDLRDMFQTDALKRDTAPGIERRRINLTRPEMLV